MTGEDKQPPPSRRIPESPGAARGLIDRITPSPDRRGAVTSLGMLIGLALALLLLGGCDHNREPGQVNVLDPASPVPELSAEPAPTASPTATPAVSAEPSVQPTVTPMPTNTPVPTATPDPLAGFSALGTTHEAGFYGTAAGFTTMRSGARVDPIGDLVACDTQSPGVIAPGADITGISIVPLGPVDEITVFFAQSPELSVTTFSWANLLLVEFVSGAREAFGIEIHDDVFSSGAFDGAEFLPTDVEIVHTPIGVVYRLPSVPSDPVGFVAARGFNTPMEGDDTGCDDLVLESISPEPGLPPGDPVIHVVDIATSTWHGILPGRGALPPFEFGLSEPRFFHPLVGDWDGDGQSSPAIFSPDTGLVLQAFDPVQVQVDNEVMLPEIGDGGGDAFPIAGDLLGDGADTVHLYDPTTGELVLLDSTGARNDGPDLLLPPGVTPVIADFDGDGLETVGFLDGLGTFHWTNGDAGAGFPFTTGLGEPGDLPVLLDFDLDGEIEPGIFRPGDSRILHGVDGLTDGGEALLDQEIFADGFESGDATAWSR